MLRQNNRIFFDKILLIRSSGKLSDGRSIVSRHFLARGLRSIASAQSVTQYSEAFDSKKNISEPLASKSDYLGIEEINDPTLVYGEYKYDETKAHKAELMAKYKPLLERKSSNNQDPTKMKRTWFGQVRLDAENKPTYHGEFEKNSDRMFTPGGSLNKPSKKQQLSNLVQHINQYEITLQRSENESSIYKSKQNKSSKLAPIEDDDNIPVKTFSTAPPQSLTNSKIKFRYAKEFAKSLRIKENRRINNSRNTDIVEEIETQKSWKDSDDLANHWITDENGSKNGFEREISLATGPVLPEEKNLENMTDEEISAKMAEVKFDDQDSDQKPMFKPAETMSGMDYLKLVQKGKLEGHFQEEYDEFRKLMKKGNILDSKGFRILKNQVPDYSKMSNEEILEVLHRQVLYNDADIVALNKPYGMSIHGSSEQETELEQNKKKSTSHVKGKFNPYLHLNYFLPELAARCGAEKLYTVHRLDRDTTGVLLLAKTQQKAKELSQLFAEHRIEKRYLCITKNCPDMPEGLIDIPIELGHIKSGSVKRERMILCPEPLEEARSGRRPPIKARQALTRYKVLSEAGNATLLEVFPQTGIRHQIRVHLGFGLRCPVLGDHKYSSLETLAPQKLPADILQRLKVRQQKVRHVPMHLHAYQCLIPQAGVAGTNIFVRAPLPYHFRKNMSSLKLRLD